MCIVCQIGTSVITGLGLSYQPTQVDTDMMLQLNQRIAQIQQTTPIVLENISLKVQDLIKTKKSEKEQYYLNTLEWIIEYNQTIYSKD